MAKRVTISIDFIIQRASQEICDKVGKPYGTIEILDSDNFRQDWAETENEAVAKCEEMVTEALGLSGGVGLGYVRSEVNDV